MYIYTHMVCACSVAQLCPTLCDPIDYSPPGSSVHGIRQARILEWVSISFRRGSSDPGIKPRSPALQADSLLTEPIPIYIPSTQIPQILTSYINTVIKN